MIDGDLDSASDTLKGEAGDDTLHGATGGGDTLDGGTGIDTVTFELSGNPSAHVEVTLSDGQAKVMSGTTLLYADTLRSIENVAGTDLDDIITGKAAPIS